MHLTRGLAIGACWLAGVLASAGSLAQSVGSADEIEQEGVPTTQATSEESWLRVTADQLNVRSRPDVNSTAVARVERDTVLRAVGMDREWYRVIPPEGVFSYVSARYVERQGAAKGVVAIGSGGLRVRVGSLLYELDPLQCEVQVLLERGSPVRILGTQGDWLKIAPPPGVTVYVHGDHVQRVSEDVAMRLVGVRAAASHSVGESIPAQSADATDRARLSDSDLEGPWGCRLIRIEEAIKAEGARPPLDQQWEDHLAQLAPIASQNEEPAVARLAAAWVKQLEQRTSDQDAYREAQEIVRRVARERAQYERELERIERLREQLATRSAYVARGTFLRSYAVGQENGRSRFKLQDPIKQRVEAYLEIKPESGLDVESMLGSYVGVRGERRRVEALGADVVLVESIDVLRPKAPATQPAREEP